MSWLSVAASLTSLKGGGLNLQVIHTCRSLWVEWAQAGSPHSGLLVKSDVSCEVKSSGGCQSGGWPGLDIQVRALPRLAVNGSWLGAELGLSSIEPPMASPRGLGFEHPTVSTPGGWTGSCQAGAGLPYNCPRVISMVFYWSEYSQVLPDLTGGEIDPYSL